MTNTLATRKTIDELATVYQAAMDKITTAYTLLAEAQSELRAAFQEDYGGFDTTDREIYSSDPLNVCEGIKAKVARTAWRAAIDRLGIRKVLSVKRTEELNDRLDSRSKFIWPAFTTANVMNEFIELSRASSTLLAESVKEVYEFLRPGASFTNKHKTNDKFAKFALGKKVVLTHLMYVDRYFMTVSPYAEPSLIAVDRVFHALDGKSFEENYRSPLLDKMSNATEGETEYFSFKIYKNGNIHLEFKRMDLVDKLNRIAGADPYLRD
jgi:hypothetical protein